MWTTFNAYQWDVNWANPDVLCEYADVILDLANHGVEVFRLDAIAFTWKRIGTNCQNQPEVHALTQALRTVARIACPAVVFKAEAIVGPQDLPAYLGQGEHHGKVSDLAYHNGLMVQIWSMLASQDARLASRALQQLPPAPSTTAWITYARCHDDIGWAISDEDAAAVGLSGFEHRRFLSDFYAGEFPGSWARGLVFQENPATGDRRISGSLASLAGLEHRGPRRRSAGSCSRTRVVLGFGGLPVIWMGDELGLLNDPDWDAEPEHAERQPLGAPAADALAAAGRRARHPGRRPAAGRGPGPALPHLHASVAADGARPARPRGAAGRAPAPARPDARRLQRDARPRGTSRSTCSTTSASTPRSVVDHVSGSTPALRDGAVQLAPYAAVWLTAG